MTIRLTYTTIEGKEKQVDLDKDVVEISLREEWIASINLAPLSICSNLRTLILRTNRLHRVDLTPLESCINLRNLDLGMNEIQNIDLTPLSSCSRLQRLSLTGNQFQSIDLTPLASCTALQELLLSENQLRSIDLTPLDSCKKLQYLGLYRNQLHNIDLAPLSSCTNLQYLLLGMNQIKSVDITPVFRMFGQTPTIDGYISSWLRPGSIVPSFYSHPTQLFQWNFLHGVAKQFESDLRVQFDIRAALGLIDYGFIDDDITFTLLSIAPETTTEDAQETLTKIILEKITTAVRRGGITTGLNLETLINKHEEIASSAQRINELRKGEIEQVVIPVDEKGLDLRELWLTAYGFEILNTLDMRLTTDTTELERIKNAFAEIDFDLRIGETVHSGVQMGYNLQESIWWIAENRGRPWNEIRDKLEFYEEDDEEDDDCGDW